VLLRGGAAERPKLELAAADLAHAALELVRNAASLTQDPGRHCAVLVELLLHGDQVVVGCFQSTETIGLQKRQKEGILRSRHMFVTSSLQIPTFNCSVDSLPAVAVIVRHRNQIAGG
jgi:hypothetical protein